MDCKLSEMEIRGQATACFLGLDHVGGKKEFGCFLSHPLKKEVRTSGFGWAFFGPLANPPCKKNKPFRGAFTILAQGFGWVSFLGKVNGRPFGFGWGFWALSAGA